MFCQELAAEGPYQACIRGVILWLMKLQAKNSQVQKMRAKKLDKNKKDFNRIWHHQNLPYILELIKNEMD